MENAIPTPENWHWAITPDDVKKIKAVDRETINRVYFDNLFKFRSMAGKFCRDHRCRSRWYEDMVQQIYVDLPKYNYTNRRTFANGIIKSFWSVFKGVSFGNCGSFETALSDDDKSLADVIGVDTFNFIIDHEDDDKQVLTIISTQDHLTDLQRDFLTAVAFACTPYRGLYAEEYRRAFAL